MDTPEPRFPARRDDFPFSLRAYVTAEAGDWSLLLYRATDPAERTWLLDNGFTLRGRQWVRAEAKERPAKELQD